MSKKLSRKFLFCLVAFVMLFSFVTPAYANASTFVSDSPSSEVYLEKIMDEELIGSLKNLGYSEEEIVKTYEDIEAISTYVSVDEYYNVTFDAKTASMNGVDEQLVSQTQNEIKRIQSLNEEQYKTYDLCPGTTGYYHPQVMSMLDNCATKTVTFWMTSGATVATLASIIASLERWKDASAAFATGAALIGFGVAYINYLNNGSGIFILHRDSGNRMYGQP